MSNDGVENRTRLLFPEIRSMGGAIFVLSSVLSLYLFAARTAFQKIPASFYELPYLIAMYFGVCLPLAHLLSLPVWRLF